MSALTAWRVLGGALAAQAAFALLRPAQPPAVAPLPAAPPTSLLRVAALGEPVALSRALMLWLQGQEDQPGGPQPLRALDYGVLRGWLEAALALDARSAYPLLAASQVYSAVDDPARVREMLDFVAREFVRDPARRWPWMAQAAVLARHRLHDLPLARRYARELSERTDAALLPAWAAQMEAWFAQDMDELQAARLLIGGMIDSGAVTNPRELQLLERRLRELERREAAPR